MAYIFYMGDIELPVTPAKLQTKIKNQNKTINLINESEVNILKDPGLTEMSFDIMIPQGGEYPFANGSRSADSYLGQLERMKTTKEPFQFIVWRDMPSQRALFDTNMKVSLEDYTITEDAKNGFDLIISIRLKQYRDYGTKTVTINQSGPSSGGMATATVSDTRPSPSNPLGNTHTVQSGDSLWNISKKYLGDGSRYNEIWELNKDSVTNPNQLNVGAVLMLP
jgi:Uncharacterized protein containing LysM domain